MLQRIGAVVLVSLVVAFSASACGGPPKQAEVPDVEKDTGADIGGTPDTSGDTQTGGDAQDMHVKCCAECKTGLAKDRSGANPDTVPCADFTDTLSPWCLEHFRAQPTVASKCM